MLAPDLRSHPFLECTRFPYARGSWGHSPAREQEAGCILCYIWYKVKTRYACFTNHSSIA